jgi:hypothetical protein
MTILSSWTTPSYWRFESRNSFNRSFYRFRWKFNNSFDDFPSVDDFPSTSRFTFVTIIVYFFTTLIGLVFGHNDFGNDHFCLSKILFSNIDHSNSDSFEWKTNKFASFWTRNTNRKNDDNSSSNSQLNIYLFHFFVVFFLFSLLN